MAADQPRSQGPLSISTLRTRVADVSGSTSSARNFLFDSIVSLSCDSSLLRQNHVYSNCCIAVPMHPSVSSDSQCSSTLRRFVFSAENKLKRILRLNHIWPITTNGNNTNNQSEFEQSSPSSVKARENASHHYFWSDPDWLTKAWLLLLVRTSTRLPEFSRQF